MTMIGSLRPSRGIALFVVLALLALWGQQQPALASQTGDQISYPQHFLATATELPEMRSAAAAVPALEASTDTWTIQRYVTPADIAGEIFVTDAEIREDDTGYIRYSRVGLDGSDVATELIAEWAPSGAPGAFDVDFSEMVDGELTQVASTTLVNSRLATPEEEACATGCAVTGFSVGLVTGTIIGGTVCGLAGLGTAGAALFICGAAANVLGGGIGALTDMACEDQCDGAPVLSKDPEVSVQCRTTGACRGTTVITRESDQANFVSDADTTVTWNYLQNNKTEVLRESYRFDDGAMASAYSYEFYPDDTYYYRAVLQTPYISPSPPARLCAVSVEAATEVLYYDGGTGHGTGSRNNPPTSRATELGSC